MNLKELFTGPTIKVQIPGSEEFKVNPNEVQATWGSRRPSRLKPGIRGWYIGEGDEYIDLELRPPSEFNAAISGLEYIVREEVKDKFWGDFKKLKCDHCPVQKAKYPCSTPISASDPNGPIGLANIDYDKEWSLLHVPSMERQVKPALCKPQPADNP